MVRIQYKMQNMRYLPTMTLYFIMSKGLYYELLILTLGANGFCLQ